MKIYSWDNIKSDLEKGLLIPGFEDGCGISIGSFDGLHQGHRLLISTLTQRCKEMNLLSGVISFTRPLPSFKHSSDYQGDLTTLNQRLKLFENAGLDFAVIVDFNEDFASLTGVEFFKLLVASFNLKYITEGVDFRCGYKGATDISAIKYFADDRAIKYDFVEPVYYKPGTDEEERISSSYIRTMVQKRFLSTVEELLVRPYSIELKVQSIDDGKIKIPLNQITQALPPEGVYHCRMEQTEVRLEITSHMLILEVPQSSKTVLNQVIELVL